MGELREKIRQKMTELREKWDKKIKNIEKRLIKAESS